MFLCNLLEFGISIVMNTFLLTAANSWFLIILSLLACVAFSVFVYRRTTPPVSPRRKAVLIFLRSAGLSLLLFAFFEPVLTIIQGSEQPPRLAVLLDNSASAIANDASGSRLEYYNLAFKNSDFNSLGADNYKSVLFDSEIKFLPEFSRDSISHKGMQTNISKALRWAEQNSEEENIQAALLITDGAFNTGRNPLYDAESFGKPVYIIGIGDSSEPKDIAVQSILTNETAYIDNPAPVNVNVKVSGFENIELQLVLKENDNQIATQNLLVNPEKEYYSAIFEYLPKTEGMNKLTASIAPQKGEITVKNNQVSEFIEVIKNKRKIALFAGGPNADIPFIKSAFTGEKGVEFNEYIQKKGAEFYNQPVSNALAETELFILIGFPIASTPPNVIQLIKRELEKGKPVLFIAGLHTDYAKLRPLEAFLPFISESSRPVEFLAAPDIKPQALSNQLLRVSGAETDAERWNALPPLFRTETFVKVKPESELISTIKVNNAPLGEPLLMTRNFQNQKSVAIMGYGLFRWKLLGYASDLAKGRTDKEDLLHALMTNAYKWLSVASESKTVRIKTSKSSFSAGEKVIINAQVYDAAFTPVDNAAVTVRVSGGRDSRELTLASLGNGRYSGSIEGLPEGDFAFTGEAIMNNTMLGADNGRFSVGLVTLEYQNLKMNAPLLKMIAERTGGKFYHPSEAKAFLEDLKQLPTYKPRGVTKKIEFALWNLPWLLAVAIFALSLEWFIRKRAGML